MRTWKGVRLEAIRKLPPGLEEVGYISKSLNIVQVYQALSTDFNLSKAPKSTTKFKVLLKTLESERLKEKAYSGRFKVSVKDPTRRRALVQAVRKRKLDAFGCRQPK